MEHKNHKYFQVMVSFYREIAEVLVGMGLEPRIIPEVDIPHFIMQGATKEQVGAVELGLKMLGYSTVAKESSPGVMEVLVTPVLPASAQAIFGRRKQGLTPEQAPIVDTMDAIIIAGALRFDQYSGDGEAQDSSRWRITKGQLELLNTRAGEFGITVIELSDSMCSCGNCKEVEITRSDSAVNVIQSVKEDVQPRYLN